MHVTSRIPLTGDDQHHARICKEINRKKMQIHWMMICPFQAWLNIWGHTSVKLKRTSRGIALIMYWVACQLWVVLFNLLLKCSSKFLNAAQARYYANATATASGGIITVCGEQVTYNQTINLSYQNLQACKPQILGRIHCCVDLGELSPN